MMVTRKGTVKRIPLIALNTRRKTGIRAITLDEGDQLINVMRTNGDDNIILATANGMASCLNESDVRPMGSTGPNGEKVAQSRGGKGLKNYNITEKTGIVAGCRVVKDTDDVMLIENGGVIIRVPAASINVYKRDVQGVIVMRVEEGNKLVSVERVEREETEENEN